MTTDKVAAWFPAGTAVHAAIERYLAERRGDLSHYVDGEPGSGPDDHAGKLRQKSGSHPDLTCSDGL
jgi:hypothetical protein